MISYGEALSKILAIADRTNFGGATVPSPPQTPLSLINLESAVGHVLGQDLYAKEALPSFDNSAMDGYAVCSESTRDASPEKPVSLKVVGSVAAGDVFPGKEGGEHAAVEIMTGAPLPEGSFDAVVRIENVAFGKGSHDIIILREPVQRDANIRRKGEDFKEGQLLMRAGRKIVPTDILALASLGVSELPVRKKCSVAVISTGKELVHHSENLSPGQIRNSTGPYLMAALREAGVDAKFYGTVYDEPSKFLELMNLVLGEKPDLIISTGAVSVGKYDFILNGLIDLRAELHFHKVAIRPGKPILFAGFEDGPAFFGLPGNPVSTAVGFRFFVLPYLRRVMGEKDSEPWNACLTSELKKPEGLRSFMKARWTPSPVASEVTIIPGQASFMVSSLLDANAWAILPEEGKLMKRGECVEVVPMV